MLQSPAANFSLNSWAPREREVKFWPPRLNRRRVEVRVRFSGAFLPQAAGGGGGPLAACVDAGLPRLKTPC